MDEDAPDKIKEDAGKIAEVVAEVRTHACTALCKAVCTCSYLL